MNDERTGCNRPWTWNLEMVFPRGWLMLGFSWIHPCLFRLLPLMIPFPSYGWAKLLHVEFFRRPQRYLTLYFFRCTVACIGRATGQRKSVRDRFHNLAGEKWERGIFCTATFFPPHPDIFCTLVSPSHRFFPLSLYNAVRKSFNKQHHFSVASFVHTFVSIKGEDGMNDSGEGDIFAIVLLLLWPN